MKENSDRLEVPTLPGQHPIYSGDYKIKTTVIEEAIDKIEQAIKLRIQGLIIYGPSGYGKSTALGIINKEMCKKYNDEILTFVCTMPSPLRNSKEFFSRILKATGHDLYNKGTAEEKSDRLCSLLINLALEENKNRKILLFIDEADSLEKTEYQSLKDINNQLALANIGMTTILIGTEDLISQRNLFSGKKETQIIRRFMQKTHVFYGIRTKKELQEILGAYDYGMKFPEESNWSYTRYFFPKSFENGILLSHETETLYNCISNIYGNKIFKGSGLSMNHLCKMVEYIFVEYGSKETNESWITEDMWIKAVKFVDCNHEQELLDACASGKSRR